MSKANFIKGDTVYVLAGDDKGKSGKVLKVDRKNDKVIVEGVNLQKKSVRRSQDNPQGGFEQIEAPVHISNVMHADLYNQRRSANQQ